MKVKFFVQPFVLSETFFFTCFLLPNDHFSLQNEDAEHKKTSFLVVFIDNPSRVDYARWWSLLQRLLME